jgi:hypothetical protein
MSIAVEYLAVCGDQAIAANAERLVGVDACSMDSFPMRTSAPGLSANIFTGDV